MKLVPPSLPRSSYMSSSFWFIVGPLLSFEGILSVLMSPGEVTGPSQGKSSGGVATLMPLDLHAFL